MSEAADDYKSFFCTNGLTWTWRDGSDISPGWCAGNVNSYESKSTFRPPLPLDKLLGGCPPAASDSPLFALLPIEVLTRIQSFLPANELINFALVNSDCRQIARSIWFETLVFDYDFERSRLSVLDKLIKESRQSSALNLGACIRRMVVATNGECFQSLHATEYDTLGKVSGDEKELQLQRAADYYFKSYIPSLTYVFKTGPKLLQTALQSPILHLRLNGTITNQELIEAFRKIEPQHTSRLQTLDIELSKGKFGHQAGHSFDLVARMLKYCSSSLRTFRWNGVYTHLGDGEEAGESPEPLPPLLNIRDLTLTSGRMRSPKDVQALLPSGLACKLVRLEVDSPDVYKVQHIDTFTEIPTLKELALTNIMGVPLSLIEANSQLDLLSIIVRDDQADIIDNTLLPLLCRRFHNLRSLAIEYGSARTQVSNFALQYISQLKSLERLHLSAGERYLWRRTWLVDHHAIRQCVRQLPKLKSLALSRDTYHPDISNTNGDHYERYYTSPDLLTARDSKEHQLISRRYDELAGGNFEGELKWKFEMIHRRRMLLKAYKYIYLRYEDGPSLDFLYFGELPASMPSFEIL
ncbi:hypothetical protein EDD36DRAFT_464531 [Exophiala viscosa]|uniref:F-box domain-containing protein n=1 Tax=Exophiala viscosa TaxID=2486360 RepID=A0AAN6DUH8_9EURO|nr:hypothetical protein EDD36DRAFT_464531 [Exophiala viscosa]